MSDIQRMDDNEEIIELIRERFKFGIDKYGHGVQVDDTSIDWETMMMEEALDGMVYAASQLIRLKRKKEASLEEKKEKVERNTVTKKNAKYSCDCKEYIETVKVEVLKADGCEHIRACEM